jgi:hypothetical protein
VCVEGWGWGGGWGGQGCNAACGTGFCSAAARGAESALARWHRDERLRLTWLHGCPWAPALQEECRGWDVNEIVFSAAMWGTYHQLMRSDFTLFDEYQFMHLGTAVRLIRWHSQPMLSEAPLHQPQSHYRVVGADRVSLCTKVLPY